MRLHAFLAVVVGSLPTVALAQSSGNSNDNGSVVDRSPLENVRSANVASRAPGNAIIRPALQRHQELQNARLRGDGDGESDTGSGSSSSGTTGAAGSTNNLLGGLLSSLTGGSLSGGALDSITSLLGNEGVTSLLSSGSLNSLLGGSLGSLFGSGSGTTTGTSGIGNTAGITPEQQASLDLLLQLRDSLGSGSTSKTRQRTQANTSASNADSAAKTAARSQTTGDDEAPRFRVRLFNSWLGTIFAAATVGVSSRDFINSIKDALRPVFGIPAPAPTTQPSGGSQVRHIVPATERITAAARFA